MLRNTNKIRDNESQARRKEIQILRNKNKMNILSVQEVFAVTCNVTLRI